MLLLYLYDILFACISYMALRWYLLGHVYDALLCIVYYYMYISIYSTWEP